MLHRSASADSLEAEIRVAVAAVVQSRGKGFRGLLTFSFPAAALEKTRQDFLSSGGFFLILIGDNSPYLESLFELIDEFMEQV